MTVGQWKGLGGFDRMKVIARQIFEADPKRGSRETENVIVCMDTLDPSQYGRPFRGALDLCKKYAGQPRR